MRGNISIELTETDGPLSATVKRIESYATLAKLLPVATNPVATLPSPFVDVELGEGFIYTIEASGKPINLPGGGDQSTGNMWHDMKESTQIAKTFCSNFVQKIDPGNTFFLTNW